MSCRGSQEGSRKKRFSTSVSRLRLVGGSPWGSWGGKDHIFSKWKRLIEAEDVFYSI